MWFSDAKKSGLMVSATRKVSVKMRERKLERRYANSFFAVFYERLRLKESNLLHNALL